MKTEKEIAEIERGCRKDIEYKNIRRNIVESRCGFHEGKKIMLCPECKAKLKDLEEQSSGELAK